MDNSKLFGSWSITNCKQYPGELEIDGEAGKATLLLYTKEYLDGSVIKIASDQVPHYLQYIFGDSSPMGKITLYDSNWAGTSMIGQDLYLTKYHVKYIIYGAHLLEKEDFLIKSGKFSFPYLDSFYNGWEHASLMASEFNFELIDKPTIQELQINDELKLIFYSIITRNVLEFTISYTIEANSYLFFEYTKPVTFSRLLKDAATFRKLLEFSYGEPSAHKIHEVQIAHDQISNKIDLISPRDYTRFSIGNFSLHKNKEIGRGSSHQNHMLISKWKMSREALDIVIVKWFSNVDFYNIYEYYLDSNNWFQKSKDAILSITMFNNRFLNLIQGLEDYYREVFETPKTKQDRLDFEAKKKDVLVLLKSNPELKKWVNDKFKAPQYATLEEKLRFIVGQYSTTIHQAFHPIRWVDFPDSAKDLRNKLSHGLNKEINLGQQIHLDYKIAQLLLCICILKSLEVPELEKMIKLNLKLQRLVQEILYQQQYIH